MSEEEHDPLVEELLGVAETLRHLHLSGDHESSMQSVSHCGMMVKAWGLIFSLEVTRLLKDKDAEAIIAEPKTASLRLADWEQRKASALEKQIADHYKYLVDKIHQQEEDAENLINFMEENDD